MSCTRAQGRSEDDSTTPDRSHLQPLQAPETGTAWYCETPPAQNSWTRGQERAQLGYSEAAIRAPGTVRARHVPNAGPLNMP
jgi:hypothetical protein